MTWNMPNILTALRLASAPAIAFILLFVTRPYADIAALILFVVASFTDFLDGYLARRYKQVTKLGAMMDPIADKAMVVIALMVLVGFSSLAMWLVLPAAIILFREVFVSGLREFLGDVAGTLKVTKLAKWKTATQMVAIAVLLAQGIFEHFWGMSVFGMNEQIVQEILSGQTEDTQGLTLLSNGLVWTSWGGIGLLWIAAVLTFITGIDYFSKAAPHLKD